MHTLRRQRQPDVTLLHWITEPPDEHVLEEIHDRVVEAQHRAPARSKPRSPRRVHH